MTITNRYELVTEEKAGGATYTPLPLADFVADQIVESFDFNPDTKSIRILDPAVGEGELLASLLKRLPTTVQASVCGFDTNPQAASHTRQRLHTEFPAAALDIQVADFLGFVLQNCGAAMLGGLFEGSVPNQFHLIIANPPYVRTQIMGAEHAKVLAKQFGLAGRVDLYYAFILGMAKVLRPGGIAGIIVSNRFMTTKAGVSVRRAIREQLHLRHVWDLGDTKIFDAAVLPAVLLAEGRHGNDANTPAFTSIYETKGDAEHECASVIQALQRDGVASVPDGRHFEVKQGVLAASSLTDVWRIATKSGDTWLQQVAEHTSRTFGDIGKIRVGVKTCADRIFIATEWDNDLELLRPLITHHVARRFRADTSMGMRSILYPHEVRDGQRKAVDLTHYPNSRDYLEAHRSTLEGRKYVLEAGRNWYEIWVPQDPAVWDHPKLVFRDIAERPCFWIDREGAVVNGDCYWLVADSADDEDALWLAAAVGNSTFIESFYDHRFNNKLYAGRRRFITQYVEQFPLPDSESQLAHQIIEMAQGAYATECDNERLKIEVEIDRLVCKSFGFQIKEP